MNAADLRHRWVRFKVNDVCVPTPAEVLNDLFGDQVIEGEVVDLTGSGLPDQLFVVVRVESLPPLLIVPIGKIRVIGRDKGLDDA